MTSTPNSDRPTVVRFAVATWRLLRWAVVFELALWRSLFRWVSRRPAVPAGGTAFSYGSSIMAVLWVFVGVSAIEVPILHLLLPWPAARIISLILGAYGLFWMIGLIASLRVYPHVLSDAGLLVRYGTSMALLIPWEDITTVRARDRTLHANRRLVVEQSEPGLVVHHNVGSQTNVDVVLRRPMPLALKKTAGEPVAEFRFAVDDPRTLVARARDYLGADSVPGTPAARTPSAPERTR